MFLGGTLSLLLAWTPYLSPHSSFWAGIFPTSTPYLWCIPFPTQQLLWTQALSFGPCLSNPPGFGGSSQRRRPLLVYLLAKAVRVSEAPHRLGVHHSISVPVPHSPKYKTPISMRLVMWREILEDNQKIWQNWSRNHRTHTSLKFSLCLTKWRPFPLFSPLIFIWLHRSLS